MENIRVEMKNISNPIHPLSSFRADAQVSFQHQGLRFEGMRVELKTPIGLPCHRHHFVERLRRQQRREFISLHRLSPELIQYSRLLPGPG